MPLDFSTIDHKATVTLSDYTGKTLPVKFNLTATTIAQATIDGQIIANRLKAISAHQIVKFVINITYTDIDSDNPTSDKEDVAYFAGETLVGRWAVQEVPGYNGPLAFQNNIDLANTLVNDYLTLFTGNVAYGYDSQLMAEFCRGWVLNRSTEES